MRLDDFVKSLVDAKRPYTVGPRLRAGLMDANVVLASRMSDIAVAARLVVGERGCGLAIDPNNLILRQSASNRNLRTLLAHCKHLRKAGAAPQLLSPAATLRRERRLRRRIREPQIARIFDAT